MAKCKRLKASDRNRAAVIAAKDVDIVSAVPAEGGGRITPRETLESKEPSSMATCGLSWAGASVSLDSNLIKEVTDAIDAASATIGQVATQTTSLVDAIQTVVDELIGLQRKSRRELTLQWAFTCLVNQDAAFLVKHSEVVTWKADAVGPVRGEARVTMRSNVVLPDGATQELDLVVNHSSNATQPRDPRSACDVTFLAKGERTSRVLTVLAVTLPPASVQVEGLIEKLYEIVEAIKLAAKQGFEEVKLMVNDLLKPNIFPARPTPTTESGAIELLRDAMSKYLEILRALVGELAGTMTLEVSSLSFQAVTDNFNDSWIGDESGAGAIGSELDDEESEDEEPDDDGSADEQTGAGNAAYDELAAFLAAADVFDAGDGIVIAEDPLWPGRSKVIVPVRELEQMRAHHVVNRDEETHEPREEEG